MEGGLGDISDFMTALDGRVAEMASACTRCGKCVEACPMPAAVGQAVADPATVIGGVLDVLAGGAGTEDGQRWAESCTASGSCIRVCPEGLNPRLMLGIARAATRRRDMDTAKRAGADGFRGMSRAVRVLSRLQLPYDMLARLGQEYDAAEEESEGAPPDVIFYTGCNILRTPHIPLLCLDIMDALRVRYKVMGGPAHCCGILQYNAGDLDTFGRIATGTVDRFRAAGAGKVLAWCPTCQRQFGDTILPAWQRATDEDPFGMTMFVGFLAERLDDLKALMIHPVNKRVGLHEHPGVGGVTEAAVTILKSVPGLEFVDLEQPRMGTQCSDFVRTPDVRRDGHEAALAAAAEAGVTTLAGVYHSCHRDMCSHERDWPFEVVNFLELVGESMGLSRPDQYKRLKIMQDIDAIIGDSAEVIAETGLRVADVRQVLAETLGEQSLPLKG